MDNFATLNHAACAVGAMLVGPITEDPGDLTWLDFLTSKCPLVRWLRHFLHGNQPQIMRR